MKISVFEDNKYQDLYPLCMMRGVFDIKTGTGSLISRVMSILGKKYNYSLFCRNSVSSLLKEMHNIPVNSFSKDDYVMLNGRVIFSEELLKFILKSKGKDEAFFCNGEPVAFCISKSLSGDLFSLFKNLPDMTFNENIPEILKLNKAEIPEIINVRILKYPWDVIYFFLDDGLNEDIENFLKTSKKFSNPKKSGNLVNHKNIFTAGKIPLSDNVVLDASSGKIVISEKAEIEPFTFIKGPVFIGSSVRIKSGTRIYGPCVIGDNSRVSGEIAESIFHSFVNKQHDGFIGHSYVCPFVNLGAGTVTSDLKNNYSEVTVNTRSGSIKTGMRFLGSIIGDHSKTSINTMLNTGTITGIFANLFGGGFHEKYVSSFSWNESGKPSIKYEPKKAVQTARIVLKRRGIEMTKEYENLILNYASLE